jgi:molecular chaperone GrpE
VTDNVKQSKRQVDDDQVSDDKSRAPDPAVGAEAEADPEAESAERKAPAKAKARRESSGSADQSGGGDAEVSAEDGAETAEAETDQQVTGDAEEATGAEEAAEAERAEEAAEAEEAGAEEEEAEAEEPTAASDGDAAEAAEPVAAADAEGAEGEEPGEDEFDEVVLEVVEDVDATEEQSGEEAMADLVAARAEAEGYLDDLRRLQAEFDNYRKRTMREQSARIASASQSLVSRLLPVLDNFELAVSHAEQSRDFDRMLKGVEMVFGELQDLLSNEGLVGIEAEGKPFDPERHEAVVAVEEEGVEAGTVLDVIRKGYEFNGRVLRPAMVKVAR